MDTTIRPLGGDVYEIDTRMAGYTGITAGYLILSDRPCLVEPGTSGSAPVVRGALRHLVDPEPTAPGTATPSQATTSTRTSQPNTRS